MRYSSEQIEFLMAIVGVMLFASLWFPLVDRLTKPLESWVRFSLAVVPLLLFIAVLAYYWRKFHD